ncbi:MAG: RNA polymerase subunit sigma, partial [Gemmatimonadetes bacterium 13_2_20CM_1_70_33]
RIKQSDAEALDKLVRSNLRFVVSVAKKYQNQGVSLSDLINEGNLGLIRAAHKFDETKGIKFISYAVWWIRQAILQALAEQSRIVRVPLNRAGTLHRIGKRSASLLQELGREPTVEEIAEGMDISEEEVAKTLSISQAHLSLDAPLTPGEDNKLLDYLPDTTNPGPDDEIFEHALTESIEGVLATLKEREAKILRLYFGLEGQEPMTLEEIGSLLGITRERVRQIKEKALARLRHVSRARALESFLF